MLTCLLFFVVSDTKTTKQYQSLILFYCDLYPEFILRPLGIFLVYQMVKPGLESFHNIQSDTTMVVEAQQLDKWAASNNMLLNGEKSV